MTLVDLGGLVALCHVGVVGEAKLVAAAQWLVRRHLEVGADVQAASGGYFFCGGRLVFVAGDDRDVGGRDTAITQLADGRFRIALAAEECAYYRFTFTW